ncbi:MAG: helix-turn-helix domain-containing protein [Rikenellaceae bacterium]|nr:helix-turn-helix domain-containing protein [Rikenellaceae bacterium]
MGRGLDSDTYHRISYYQIHGGLKEISIILQFENPEYFATQFKKKTGISPTEFRNR